MEIANGTVEALGTLRSSSKEDKTPLESLVALAALVNADTLCARMSCIH